MLGCIRIDNRGGVLIDISVIPNSKKTGFDYDEWSKRLKIRISEPASKGKANKSILKTFSKLFGNCKIISGRLSGKKTILVRNCKIEDVNRMLERMIGMN